MVEHYLVEYLFKILIKINANNTRIYKKQYYSEQTLLELLRFLESKGFPDESFDIQCPVSKYFASYAEAMSPDLTIINPDTMQPIAFFRTYASIEEYKRDKLFDEAYHLNKHSDSLLLYPYYVVIKNEGHLQFYNLHSLIICSNGKNPDPIVATSEPIKFSVLQNNNNLRVVRSKLINRDKLQHFGKITLYIIVPILIITLLILDGLEIYIITELRLIALGMIILSIFIPYVSQISIKDISVIFKDKKRKKQEESNSL